MGTNSKTAHHSYSIAPTAPAEPTIPAVPAPTAPALTEQAVHATEIPEESESGPVPPNVAALELLEQAQLVAGQVLPANGESLTSQFQDFAGLIGEADKQIAIAEQAGIDADAIQSLRAIAHQTSLDYLNGLTPAQLQQIAADQGFQHPALVGLSGSAQHPLVHWLDPSYDAGLVSKAKIQAAALDRYAKLVAGQTVAGMMLADLHQLEGTPPSAGTGHDGTVPPSAQPTAAGTSTGASAAGSAGQPAVSVKTLADIAAAGAPTSFATKHNDLIAALQHAQATASDLPERIDPATVASWGFGPGSAAGLGGVHTKSVHAAPDGSTWMFKPDKTAGGARAHVEAAASAAFDAGGVPSVPVYATEINGQQGSIQPLLKGANDLSPTPSSWSQADVDAMVRAHVASWLVGDHDGHSANMLRTASGGLVPIDQGQSFKFYGSDKLSLDYHPNSAHGTSPPVYQAAYKAHLAGTLASGVKINPAAAHPVIKKYEQIPNATWRAMLTSTAHEGAKNNLHWVPVMRERAAASLGIPANKVTHQQIAEAFLDHACERKKTLRQDFADFFTSQVKVPTGALLRHRG
jgi:hypothetical protein